MIVKTFFKHQTKISKLIRKSKFCAYCGKQLSNSQKTLDHLIPKSSGGHNSLNNVVVCCYDCNIDKSNNDINEYINEPYVKEWLIHYLITVNFKHKGRCYMERIINTIYPETIRQIIPLPADKEQFSPESYTHYIANKDHLVKLIPDLSSLLDIIIESKSILSPDKLCEIIQLPTKQLINNIYAINNQTGLIPLNKPATNGIPFNPYYKEFIHQSIAYTVKTKKKDRFNPDNNHEIECLNLKDNFVININAFQKDIICVYLKNPDFNSWNDLSKILSTTKTNLRKAITKINSRTGLILFSKDKYGFFINPLFVDIHKIKEPETATIAVE